VALVGGEAEPAARVPEPRRLRRATDEIAARLGTAVEGADALVVQGGINDIAQHRPVETAAQNLAGMVQRARSLGLRVALVDVLPWPNGAERAAADIARLNALLATLASGLDVPLLPFNRTLADPAAPERMRDDLCDDGDHPSVEGHRLLGEQAFSPF
jgi:lysophospholipase L1-like esterase